MKKILFFGSILFIIVMLSRLFINSVQTSKYRPQQVQGVTINTEYPTATRTPQPTATIILSATIDYQQTAIIAQSTADEARRINAMATVEYVALLNQQIAFTAEVERQNFEIISWTQTAALTSIPLTATQQAIINTQIPQQQQIIAAQLTATKGAPTQMIAMVNAQNYAKYADANQVAGIVGKWSIGVFVIGVLIFLFRLPMTTKLETPQKKESQLETVVWVKNTKDNGAQSTRLVVPCTPGQLTELATNITQGTKTLGINQWEGAGTLFTRDVILRVRAWIRDNQFALTTDGGQLAPTDELFDFLCGWLETSQLPTEYQFAPHSPDNGTSPNHAEIMGKQIIPMMNHAHDNGGGGQTPF